MDNTDNLQMLTDELIEVRRFCYLNGFYHMDLKELVNYHVDCIDAFSFQAGAFRAIIQIKARKFQGKEYYLYEISCTPNYTKYLCTGSLSSRDFKAIKEHFARYIHSELKVVEDDGK